MTHQEILNTFFSHTYETEFHDRIRQEKDFEVPVDRMKDFMVQLTQVSLAECFFYLDNHPSAAAIRTSDLTQCSSLEACTDELCAVLQAHPHTGLSIMEIGRSALYEKYLRAPHAATWSRFGNHQAKTAQQFGLAFKDSRRWFLSCFGYAYVFPHLNARQQQRFLVRALLRNPFYAQVLSHVRYEEVHLSQFMKGLSPSTVGARISSVLKLLRLALDEMDREGQKWHDLYVPRYNARKKTLTEQVVKGTHSALDDYPVNDEFFEGGIPLYSVKAACGYFVEHEVPEQEGWMDLSGIGTRTNSEDFFVVRAKGDSMLPKIKDGDLCLFKWYKGEGLYDDIVLTQCRDYDEEYESSYTIKRFRQQATPNGAARTVSLEPLNRAKYSPILLSEDDGCDYKTIGIFVKVIAAS